MIVASARFDPYSFTHLLVLGSFAAMCVVLVWLRRWWRDRPAGRVMDLWLGVALLMGWMWVQTFGLLPWRYEPAKALPMHVCDLAGILAPLTLWLNLRPLRAILYYWGIGLSSQGFFTPDLTLGPDDWSFWVFWAGHFTIVGAAIYDIAARGFRPGWRDLLWGAGAAAAYVAIILPIDLWFGFNYGYVGRSTPDQPSVLDVLGPWPQRVFLLCGLVAFGMTMMTLPWVLIRNRRERPIPAREPLRV